MIIPIRRIATAAAALLSLLSAGRDAAQLYGIKKEDLVELVDDIRGAEHFLEEVYGGIVMYL